MIDLCLTSAVRMPLCTSEAITLSNLDIQLGNLRRCYAQTRRFDAGIQLAHGLLSRYSVLAHEADLDHVEAPAYGLVEQAEEDPRAWMASPRSTPCDTGRRMPDRPC